MTVLLANNAASTIAVAVLAADTSVVVATGGGASFPSPSAGEYFYATLVDVSGNSEIVKVTAVVSDTLTVVRAQEGTTALGFPTGSSIELRVTAASVGDSVTDFATSTTVLTNKTIDNSVIGGTTAVAGTFTTLTADTSLVFGASGPTVTAGTGSPEGAVTAPVGALRLRTDGASGTALYVKTSGSGNTGWTETAYGATAIQALVGVRFDTVAAMVADTALALGDYVNTLGRNSPGDGGAAVYKIVAAATGTADGGSYIDLTGTGLQAELQHGNHIKAEQFGVQSGVESSAAWQAAAYFAADLSRTQETDAEHSVKFSCYVDFLAKDTLYFTKTPSDPLAPWNGAVCEVDIDHPGRITATTGGGLDSHLSSEAARLGVTLGTSAANDALREGFERPMPLLNLRVKRTAQAYFGGIHCEFLCSGIRYDSCSALKVRVAQIWNFRKYGELKTNNNNGGLVLDEHNAKQWGLSDTSDYSGRMMPNGANEPENYVGDCMVSCYKDHTVLSGTYGWSRSAILLLDATRDISSITSVANAAALPAATPDGLERITADDDHLYRVVSGAWVDKGPFYSDAEIGKRTYPDALARAATNRWWTDAARGVDYVMTSQGCGDNYHYGVHVMQGFGGTAEQPRINNLTHGGPASIRCWNQTNKAYFIGCDIDASTIQLHGDAIHFFGGSFISGGKNKVPVWNGSSFDSGTSDRAIIIDPRVRVYAKQGHLSSKAYSLGLDSITGATVGFFDEETGIMAGDYSAWNVLNRQDTGAYTGVVDFKGFIVSSAAVQTALLGIGVSPCRVGLHPSPAAGNQWIVGEDDTGYNIRPLAVNYDADTGNFTAGLVVTGGTSGATGTIQTLEVIGSTGTLRLTGVTGTFLDNEVITDTSTGVALVYGAPTTTTLVRGDIITAIAAGATSVWDDTKWFASSANDGNGYSDVPMRAAGQGAIVHQPENIVVPSNVSDPTRTVFRPTGKVREEYSVGSATYSWDWDGTDVVFGGASSYAFGERVKVMGSGSGDIITGSVSGVDTISLFNNVANATAGLKPYDAAGNQVTASELAYSRTADKWFIGYAYASTKEIILRSDINVTSGTGSPETAVTAPVGSMYMRTDGGTGTTLYVKESGTGNTGWVAK